MMNPKVFLDWEISWNITRLTEAKWGNPFPDCNWLKWVDWNCCELHKSLKHERWAMRETAKEFSIDKVLLSPAWWQAFGEKYGLELPDGPAYRKGMK